MRAAPEAVQDSPYSPSAAKFTAAHRLLRKDGFGRVLGAENIVDRYFKIFFAHNDRDNARLGIISSKKTLPRSVDRNRAKRLIREVFRQHNIKFINLDLVIMVRAAYAKDVRAPDNCLAMLLGRVENRCAE